MTSNSQRPGCTSTLPIEVEVSDFVPPLPTDSIAGRRLIRPGQFAKAVEVLRRREAKILADLDSSVRERYALWCEHYENLKQEFNAVWDLFQSLEHDIPGWYCVSPNLAQCQAVGWERGGYTFAACIMKNHHRNAPLSEKSLSVSFGLDELPRGIGDERALG